MRQVDPNLPEDLKPFFEWLEKPYLGIGLYGKYQEYIHARNFLSMALQMDSIMCRDNYKRVEIGIYKGSMEHTNPSGVTYVKCGKSWEKIFNKIEENNIVLGEMIGYPPKKMSALRYSYLTYYSGWSDTPPISFLDFGAIWDHDGPIFNICFVKALILILLESIKFLDLKYGLINLFPDESFFYLWPRGFTPLSNPHYNPKYNQVPLLSELYNGQIAVDQVIAPPTPWTGQPFNLAWGNLIELNMAKSIDLIEFLTKNAGYEFLGSLTEIPEKKCLGIFQKKYVFFNLSGSIEDSLNPDESYTALYKLILDYYISKRAIYGGL